MRKLTMLFALSLLAVPPLLWAQDGFDTRARLDAFRQLDANGDGVLSRAEAAKRPEVAAGFQGADANRDGRLSFAEFERIALSRG
jgi:hypothetical protein